MDQELFESSGWDQADTISFTYYDCVLKQPIGDLPVGKKFDSANLDFERGLLDFYEEDNVVKRFRLSFSFKEESVPVPSEEEEGKIV